LIQTLLFASEEKGDSGNFAGGAASKPFRKNAGKKFQKAVIHAELPDIEEKKEELQR